MACIIEYNVGCMWLLAYKPYISLCHIQIGLVEHNDMKIKTSSAQPKQSSVRKNLWFCLSSVHIRTSSAQLESAQRSSALKFNFDSDYFCSEKLSLEKLSSQIKFWLRLVWLREAQLGEAQLSKSLLTQIGLAPRSLALKFNFDSD